MSHPWYKYFYLKPLVFLLRFAVTRAQHPIKAKPDSNYTYKSRDGKRNIAVHVYRPKSVRTVKGNEAKPTPVLLNWHSGGHILPLHGQDDLFCRTVANQTEYTVLDAEYALAPEHPFPAAFEDVEDLILSVLNQPDIYDVKNIALSGFSAGATLALAMSASRKTKIPHNTLRTVIAFYPPTNLAADPWMKRGPDGAPPQRFKPALLSLFVASYVPTGRGISVSDTRISPALADGSDFPDNVMIVTRGNDLMAPEGEALASKIKDAGKNVIIRRVEDVSQNWEKSVREGSYDAKKRDEMYDLAVDTLVKAIL